MLIISDHLIKFIFSLWKNNDKLVVNKLNEMLPSHPEKKMQYAL